MKKIVFILSFIILIVSTSILFTHFIINRENYYLILNNEGFIPKVILEKINGNETTFVATFDELDKVDEIEHSVNGNIHHNEIYFIINDNAPRDEIVYNFRGDYEIEDKKLIINEYRTLIPKENYVTISLKEDLSDFNTYEGRTYDFYNLLTQIKNLNKDTFVINLDFYNYNDIIYDEESRVFWNADSEVAYVNNQNEIIILNQYSPDSSQYKVINDNLGYDYKVEDEYILIFNTKTNAKHKIKIKNKEIYEKFQ